MKKIFSFTVASCLAILSLAQNNEQVAKLIQEGIAFHDRGEYEEAIKKYDAALDLDKNNFDALYEKSFSLYAQRKLKECINISKDLLKKFSDHPNITAVYMQYGSALDDFGKSKDALEIYDEAIGKFPNEYLLRFNKGLTLMKLNKNDEALQCYQSSLKLQPLHSSSNLYTGMLLQNSNRIPAILAYSAFLAIEPQTKRSKDAFDRISSIMGANIKKEGNNTTIFLDALMLGNKKEKKENDFSSVEMIFILMSATDGNKEMDSIAKTPADKLSFKLQMLINSLGNNLKDGKGFYWEHYVPFFAEMKEKKHVGTLAHLMYRQSDDAENNKWLEENEKAREEFYDWLKGYEWKGK
jgi:tetratricopeptide (TPR) repeat protein